MHGRLRIDFEDGFACVRGWRWGVVRFGGNVEEGD